MIEGLQTHIANTEGIERKLSEEINRIYSEEWIRQTDHEQILKEQSEQSKIKES